MRLNTIFSEIFVVFALVMIVCIGLTGWFVIRFSGNIVSQTICDADRTLAGRIAQEIQADAGSLKPTVTLLAQTPELRRMEATKVSIGVDRVQRAFPEITLVYVADMEGRQIYRTDAAGQLENVSGMRSFQVARAGDKFSSDIYLKPATLEPMQTITLPIMDSGTVVGVLSADISFWRVMRGVMSVGVGEDVNVIVVADNGRVIAHTHMEQVREVDLSRLPVVKAVLAGKAGTIKGYTDEFGREVVGTYMPISEMGWGVVIQRPLSSLFAGVGQLRMAIIWILIACVLLVLPAGWLMSRQIAKPIGQIASASKRVAQGDLSISVDVKSSNEVGLLAHSFNQMVMSLKKAKDEIQHWGEDLEKSRNALKESEVKYREVVQTSVDGVISIDSQMKVGVWNNGAERIFGYTAEEMLGQTIMKIVPERYRKEKKDGFVEFRKSGAGPVIGKTLELQGLGKDGTEIPVELSVSSKKMNETYIATAVVRDITERKQAEERLQEYSEQLEEMVEERTKELLDTQEQLVRSEKLAVLGQLAGGVAHELRNPLAVMSNAVYYLSSIITDADETTREYLEMISSEVGNAEGIVSDLLDFSRTRSLEREEVTASELVARVLEKRPSPEKVKVTTGIPPELPPVFVDPRQIGQVLGNLVANACHAMAEGGNLTISAQAEKKKVSLFIADTGCGISKENMEKIFEPLFTTRARGIGLGLAVSRNLVELNGGSIEVQSEEGKGSTFTVTLPAKEVIS